MIRVHDTVGRSRGVALRRVTLPPSCDKGSFNRCCLPQSPCLRIKPSEFLLSAKASFSQPRFLVPLFEETKFSKRIELERGPMSARTLLVVIVGLAAVIQDM